MFWDLRDGACFEMGVATLLEQAELRKRQADFWLGRRRLRGSWFDDDGWFCGGSGLGFGGLMFLQQKETLQGALADHWRFILREVLKNGDSSLIGNPAEAPGHGCAKEVYRVEDSSVILVKAELSPWK